MKYNTADSLGTKTGHSGYTLIEVLIALAIFSIGILAVSAMQIHSINYNASARMQTEETAVAVHWMERLIARPWDHDELNQGGNPHEVEVEPFTVTWNVTTPDPGDPVFDGVPVKRIALTVSSANPNAKPVTIRFIKGQNE